MGELHPAIVHLPIGILTLYTISEFLRFGIFKQDSWMMTKLFLVVSGVLGAFLGLSSGEARVEMLRETQLTELHENFASGATWVYAILAFAYILWYLEKYPENKILKKFLQIPMCSSIFVLANWIRKPIVAMVLAVVGFALLGLTGVLGGAMVYGKDTDIFVSTVLKMLGAY